MASLKQTALAAMTWTSGPPCVPGKDGFVDGGAVFFAGQDHAGARTAECLVRGGGDDVGLVARVRVDAGGDEAGEVRHVDEQYGSDRIGDLAEARESR